MKSESIKEIASALSKFQASVEPVKKTNENPFFHSKYADLSDMWESIRLRLGENGLSVSQMPDGSETLETILMHSSGEWISSTMRIRSKDDSAQSYGSALTYARRYALSAILGLSSEDDDGNAASGQSQNKTNAGFTNEPLKKQLSKCTKAAEVEKVLSWWNENETKMPAEQYRAGLKLITEKKLEVAA